MKKLIIIFVFGLLAILLTYGYLIERGSFSNISKFGAYSQTLKSIESEFLINTTSIFETYQDAYATFLRNFPICKGKEIQTFSLRDIDNNGIKELIIIQSDGVLEALLTVYSYNGNVYKVGDYSDPKIAVAGLRVTNNHTFPGLFTLWWGGGIEHYGYLTTKEGKLIYEDLWYIDRTKTPPNQYRISENVELVNESISAHPPSDYSENLLEMHFVEENSIAEIFDCGTAR